MAQGARHKAKDSSPDWRKQERGERKQTTEDPPSLYELWRAGMANGGRRAEVERIRGEQEREIRKQEI